MFSLADRTKERIPAPARAAVRRAKAPFGVPLRSLADPALLSSPQVLRAWSRVNREQLTYDHDAHLDALVRATLRAERNEVPGEVIEAGCALGGTSILLAAAKRADRPMRIFDVFGMIPEPSERDGADMHRRHAEIAAGASEGLGDGVYYAYLDDLMSTVADNLERCGYPIDGAAIEMIKGKVEDTLVVDGPVMFANIDVDWFEPVTACLERIVPHVSLGGAVFVQAYGNWSGSRAATDEFWDRFGRDDFEFEIVDGALLATRIR